MTLRLYVTEVCLNSTEKRSTLKVIDGVTVGSQMFKSFLFGVVRFKKPVGFFRIPDHNALLHVETQSTQTLLDPLAHDHLFLRSERLFMEQLTLDRFGEGRENAFRVLGLALVVVIFREVQQFEVLDTKQLMLV